MKNHTLFRIPFTGKVVAIENDKCAKCRCFISWEETRRDLENDEAWPDDSTYLCERCR